MVYNNLKVKNHKKFFKTLNKDPQAYIKGQNKEIRTLTSAINEGILTNNLVTKNTAKELARSEVITDFALECLNKYPNKIKVSSEELEIIINNFETILKLLEEIKETQKETLLQNLSVWDILINMEDNYSKYHFE